MVRIINPHKMNNIIKRNVTHSIIILGIIFNWRYTLQNINSASFEIYSKLALLINMSYFTSRLEKSLSTLHMQ